MYSMWPCLCAELFYSIEAREHDSRLRDRRVLCDATPRGWLWMTLSEFAAITRWDSQLTLVLSPALSLRWLCHEYFILLLLLCMDIMGILRMMWRYKWICPPSASTKWTFDCPSLHIRTHIWKMNDTRERERVRDRECAREENELNLLKVLS